MFRENLKVETPWVIRAVNIEIMLDGLHHEQRGEVFYVATHLSNLLKVSERTTIRRAAGRTLENCELFDLYQGDQIEAGFKSMAYTLTFRAKDHTLQDEEVNASIDKILKKLGDQGVTLREV